MKRTSAILCKAVASSLLGALLASGPAQAEPRPYSKTFTFTLSTPAPSAPRYAPAATKYATVKLTRAHTDVAMETLKIAHEGLAGAPRNRARPEGITIPVERIERR
jgi:hypothetical protein